MSRPVLAGLLTALSSLAAPAALLAQNTPTLPAPPSLASQFDVLVASVQSLTVPAGNPQSAVVDVVLAGRPERLELALHDVRSPGFQLVERGGAGLQPLPLPPCVTYRGSILGDAGSDVAATIAEGSITAYLRRGSGKVWVVQPVRQVQPTAGAALHIVYRGSDSAPLSARCGVTALGGDPMPVHGEDTLYEAELAVEADYPFFQLNGSSTTATHNDITGIVNAMNVIYERDVDLRLVLSYVIVDTTAPDPYSSLPVPQVNQLALAFQNHWNVNHGSVQRDLAHLFTGRLVGAASGGTVGTGRQSSVCSLSLAYGISQSRFTSNYSYRVALTTHEIGHNFGATHCDFQPSCNIMCSGIGGCTANVSSFGPTAQGEILALRPALGCLTPVYVQPQITGINPGSVETVDPDLVTLTGSGFTGANAVLVDSSSIGSAFTVVSDTELEFTPPQGLALAPHTVSTSTPAGASNAISLQYTHAVPAKLLVPQVVIHGTSVTWTMGGYEDDYAYLVLSLTNTSSPWLGWNLVDSPTLLWHGPLDTRGMASFQLYVPSISFLGLQVYSQLIDVVPAPQAVRSLSTIERTVLY